MQNVRFDFFERMLPLFSTSLVAMVTLDISSLVEGDGRDPVGVNETAARGATAASGMEAGGSATGISFSPGRTPLMCGSGASCLSG